MATRLILRVISGPFGDTNKLTICQARIQGGQTLTVGRNRLSADLGVRQDPRMSGKHFELALEGDVCRIYDLESRNGTHVNGKAVKEAILSDGDEIRAGHTVFQVAIQGGANLSSTVIEFGAIGPISADQLEAAEEPEATPDMGADVDDVFDQLKARMKGRQ